jgi:hypothetical protein
VPQLGLKLAAAAAGALGAKAASAKLGARDILLKTRVAAEVEWLIATELLELPFSQGARVAQRDALAEEIQRSHRIHAIHFSRCVRTDETDEDKIFKVDHGPAACREKSGYGAIRCGTGRQPANSADIGSPPARTLPARPARAASNQFVERAVSLCKFCDHPREGLRLALVEDGAVLERRKAGGGVQDL